MLTSAAQNEFSQYGSEFLEKMTPKILGGNVNELFTISFHDANSNGVYDEVNVDFVAVSVFGKDSVFTHPSVSNSFIKSKTTILANKKIYKVEKINAANDFVDIVLCENCNKNETIPTIKLLDFIPDIRVQLINGTEISLPSLIDNEKYIYIEFWGSWCAPCISMMPELKGIYKKHFNKLTILSLNYHDTPEDAKQIIAKFEMDWINGFSDNQINSELHVLGFPSGILFDKHGKLVESNINLKKLNKILSAE